MITPTSWARCCMAITELESQKGRPEPAPLLLNCRNYAVRMVSDLSPEMAACAAASRAMGTRYGEQDT